MFGSVVLAEGANGFVGHSALIIGFAACLFGALGLVTATTTRNPRLLRTVQTYGWIALVGAVVAIAVMVRALVVRDWSLAYVQKVGSYDTPALFNFTAVWSALEGSILLWLLLLAPGWLAWGVISIWFLYRIVMGMVRMNKDLPMET